MYESLFKSLSLAGPSGQTVLLLIGSVVLLATTLTIWIRSTYQHIISDLQRHSRTGRPLDCSVLQRILSDANDAVSNQSSTINPLALIEMAFQSEMRFMLMGERFVKSSTGLSIILGLVGTFFGLTIAIGKLAALITQDSAAVQDFTALLTDGLTQALGGMSIAFGTSLVGILAAIVLTLLGVFANVAEQRIATWNYIESYLDREIFPSAVSNTVDNIANGGGAILQRATTERLEQVVAQFDHSVAMLETSVESFDSALQSFSSSTREFQEFNRHLKDNISRMSLCFADLSEAMKQQSTLIRRSDSPSP